MADDIVVINQPLERRTQDGRGGAAGKVRYSVSVQSEPLVHVFDPKTMGKVVAEAIAEELRQKILAITQKASAATLSWRKSAERGLTNHAESKELRTTAHAKREVAAGRGHLLDSRGKWAQARYNGGRLGFMPPNQSDRLFNDSGRFAKSITANARDDAWTVNVAANRLDPDTAGGETAVQKIWQRLVELVPAFGNSSLLFSEERVQKAVVQSLEAMIVKARETRDQLSEARIRGIVSVARAAMTVLRTIAA